EISLITSVIGALAVGFGTWLMLNKHLRGYMWEDSARIRILSDAAFTYTISILVTGGALVVVGVCGACTRASKLHRLRFVFSGSVCALILMVLIAVLMLIWQWMDVDNQLRTSLDYLVQKYYQGASAIPEILDQIQRSFLCCGSSGCSDFRAFYMDIPRSCDLSCEGCTRRVIIALRTTLCVSAVVAVLVIICGFIAEAIVVLSWKAEDTQWRRYMKNRKTDTQALHRRDVALRRTLLNGGAHPELIGQRQAPH
uniref:Tetraspanin n=1 Tax=Parascaris univalens TaxID=6257 RepID=A0A915AML0_PARUN